MKKKIGIGVIIIIVLFVAWNTLSSKISWNNGDTTQEQQQPVTTTPLTLMDSVKLIQEDIDAIQRDIITNKTNDAVIQAKLDQLIQIVQTLEAEIAALQK
jgi:peptidoglycan hydrolase CwlO-like protein